MTEQLGVIRLRQETGVVGIPSREPVTQTAKPFDEHSAGPNAVLPATLTDDANKPFQLGTTDRDAVPSFTFSTVTVIPDTPPDAGLSVPEASNRPLSGSLPFSLQDTFSNAGVGHIDIAVDSFAMHTPPSDTNAWLISPPDHVGVVVEERNMTIIPAGEMFGSCSLSGEREIPACTSTFHLRSAGSQAEFSQAEVASPTVANNQDIVSVAPSSFVNLVSESHSALPIGNKGAVLHFPFDVAVSSPINSSTHILTHVEPITELGAAVTLDAQAEALTLSAPSVTILPPTTSSIFAPGPSEEQINRHISLHVQPSPKHQRNVMIQRIPDSKDVPHQIGALPPCSTQTTDMPQGMDMPHAMDVDVLSDMDSDSEGYASDSDNQARSDILKSNTYRRIKSRPVSLSFHPYLIS